jgi:hypothetical protein
MSGCNTSRKWREGSGPIGEAKTLGDEERARERLESYHRGLWSGTTVQYTHPTPYVIETTATTTVGGQSVTTRYAAPTAEECLRLKRMDEMDNAVAEAMEAEDAKAEAEHKQGMALLGRHLKGMCGATSEATAAGGEATVGEAEVVGGRGPGRV